MRGTALGRGRGGRRDAAAAAATAPMDCLDSVAVRCELLRRIPRGDDEVEGGRRWCVTLLLE